MVVGSGFETTRAGLVFDGHTQLWVRDAGSQQPCISHGLTAFACADRNMRDLLLLLQLATTGSGNTRAGTDGGSEDARWGDVPMRPRWRVKGDGAWKEARITAHFRGAGSVFGDAEARARRMASTVSPHVYTRHQASGMTETEVLCTSETNWTWGGPASATEMEQLLTAASAPLVRIPLLLSYIANDHEGLLFTPAVRDILSGALLEPGLWLRGGDATCADGLVPSAALRGATYGSTFGVLLAELLTCPTATVGPLLTVAAKTADMCSNADVGASCVITMLWLVRLLVSVQGYLTAAVALTSPSGGPSADAAHVCGVDDAPGPLLALVSKFLRARAYPLLRLWASQAATRDMLAHGVLVQSHIVLVACSALACPYPPGTDEPSAVATDVTAAVAGMAFVTMWHCNNHAVTYVTRVAAVPPFLAHAHVLRLANARTRCVQVSP